VVVEKDVDVLDVVDVVVVDVELENVVVNDVVSGGVVIVATPILPNPREPGRDAKDIAATSRIRKVIVIDNEAFFKRRTS
jgi:hypothetical protein